MAAHRFTTSRSLLFQATSVVGIATGGTASYALSTYTADIATAARCFHFCIFGKLTNHLLFRCARYGATLTNVGMNAAGALSVTAGALTGTACGLLYLVILFYPGHGESKKSVLLKEISFLICTVLFLVAALVATVSCSFHPNVLRESNGGLRFRKFTCD